MRVWLIKAPVSAEVLSLCQVFVEGCEGQLKGLVTELLTLQPNKQYSVSDVEREVSRVFQTGFFSSARPKVTQDHGAKNFEITIQVRLCTPFPM